MGGWVIKRVIGDLYYLYLNNCEPIARMFIVHDKLYVVDNRTNRIDHGLLNRHKINKEDVLIAIQKENHESY